jgi:hypothetical protein
MQPVLATCQFFYKFGLVFNLWQGLESILEGMMTHLIRQFCFLKSDFVTTKKTFVFVRTIVAVNKIVNIVTICPTALCVKSENWCNIMNYVD